MKAVILIAASLSLSATAVARDTYVRPHVRSDGTYVQGHYRSSPNSTPSDNYSTSPNYNPYTGKQGTVDPYAPPRVQPYQYKPQTYAPPKPPAPLYGFKQPRGY